MSNFRGRHPTIIKGHVTDPTPLGAADASLPVLPLRWNLLGCKYLQNGANKMGSFKICVSAGRGILVDETFDEQKSSPSWGKPLQEYSPPLLLPFFNYEGQEGRIRITRLVDVRF